MALRRVRADVLPFFGGGSLTPARRALERPMAMACLAERAPCLPSRMWCISSRTNSPAWVEGALPCSRSRRARSMVCLSGINSPKCDDSGPAGKSLGRAPGVRVGGHRHLACGHQFRLGLQPVFGIPSLDPAIFFEYRVGNRGDFLM